MSWPPPYALFFHSDLIKGVAVWAYFFDANLNYFDCLFIQDNTTSRVSAPQPPCSGTHEKLWQPYALPICPVSSHYFKETCTSCGIKLYPHDNLMSPYYGMGMRAVLQYSRPVYVKLLSEGIGRSRKAIRLDIRAQRKIEVERQDWDGKWDINTRGN